MKKLSGIVGILILLASSLSTFAIEGLKVSVQATNAVLAWPSTNSETFLVQHRSTLNPTDSWATLVDFLPADSDTNVTLFVHSNAVPPATGFYRVVRDGAYMYVTNGALWTDFVTVPVELGNSYGTAGTMSLTENGDPVGDSVQPAGTSLLVDSTQMSNGVHQVSVSTSWTDTNGNYIEADSIPVTVLVSNEISYPDWIPNYGEIDNVTTFQAVSLHTNADWEIDVYGSDYYYIGSFTGTTTDGNIQAVWNLVDPEGNVRTNDTFFICEITTWYDSDSGTSPIQPMYLESSQSISPKTYHLPDTWIGPGGFVSVEQHAWDTSVGSDLLYQELKGFTGAAESVNWSVLPTPGDNGTPYGLAFGADNPQGDTDWANFRSALYNPISRNLVYFGHGGPDALGYNPANTNRYITATEIGTMLHNLPAGQTNAHHYRFCFVDGCSTAKGQMPEAFGIWHKENVQGEDYADAGMRYSAYVGWKSDKIIGVGVNGGEGEINTEHVNFIVFIQDDMLLNNANIKDAMQYAASQPGITSFTKDSMTVYGFWQLTFGLDNY